MEADRLKIALLPYDIAWADIAENLMNVSHLLDRVDRDTDIVVLPEMFSTGFITEPTLLCSIDAATTRHTIETIHHWAAKHRMAISGTIVAAARLSYYNRAFFIEPSGDETYYDKRHLFSVGGEARTFTPGQHHCPIIRYRGANIMMSVCYDVRFPVWNRNTDYKYDILLIPANWPDARIFAWRQLLIARAIENQAYVMGCNRTGRDDFGTYSDGHTFALNDWGDNINQPCPKTGIIYATVELDKLRRHREKFPIYRDADTFRLT